MLNKPYGKIFGLVAFLVLLAFSPALLGQYSLHLMILVMIYVVIATSWNILVWTHQISLGHAAFFGIGAYTGALIFKAWGLTPYFDMLMGGIFASVSAVILGIICLRMAPWALAIATVSFAEAMKILVINVPGLTEGAEGVGVLPLFGGGEAARVKAYYLIFGIAFLCVLMAYLLKRSKLYYAFTAIHDDQEAANMMGINPTKYKVMAFTISAFFVGVVGSFYAHYIAFIDPHSVFNVHISVESQIMPLMGGLYTVAGPVVGAFILTLLGEYLRITIKTGYLIVYGIILVMVIFYLPRGLVGLAGKWLKRK
ncbi:MAG TPA: branched-chain amino acid ABC transporter permease [Thermodesulfobacteriota bacterium]|nr:branched-chain amino acid ABC transporter permease [Thermodesulfobacteriota bacterium]